MALFQCTRAMTADAGLAACRDAADNQVLRTVAKSQASVAWSNDALSVPAPAVFPALVPVTVFAGALPLGPAPAVPIAVVTASHRRLHECLARSHEHRAGLHKHRAR